MHRRMPLSIVAVLLFAGIISAEDTRSGVLARLRHDLSFLASAECEGRGPGTEGIDRAADFIADAFRQAGLKGAMPDGSFFQPFSIRGTSSLGKDVG